MANDLDFKKLGEQLAYKVGLSNGKADISRDLQHIYELGQQSVEKWWEHQDKKEEEGNNK